MTSELIQPDPPDVDPAIVDRVADVLRAESAALQVAADGVARQADSIRMAIDLLLRCPGRLIVIGMGKMGYIGRKATATFCSTGTPAVFLHPSEAMHGDLGILTDQDVVLFLSHSGETREVIELLPFTARLGVATIAITGSPTSSLAKQCGSVIDTAVQQEVDPIAPAPTNSSTVTLAWCDAIAVALMHARGFTEREFAIFHPGGHLGSKLLLHVADLMHSGDQIPRVGQDIELQAAITVISQKRLGAVFVEDQSGVLQGVITDGDLRRLLEVAASDKQGNVLQQPVSNFMTPHPKHVDASALAAEALRQMEIHGITVLPVLGPDQRIVGVIHLHDLVRAGLA